MHRPLVGVTAPDLFPSRPGPNRWVAEERPALTLTERIGDMLATSEASIALQGSIGTMTELLVAWNDAFIAALDGGTPAPVVAVGDVWAEFVSGIGRRLTTDASLVTCVEDVDGAVETVAARLG